MQAAESQTVILYYSDLPGEWPLPGAGALTRALPYARRLELTASGTRARASLAGIALALHALSGLGRPVRPGALRFPQWGKPVLRDAPLADVDFSVSHSGPWVACAAVCGTRIGLDIECGESAQVREWVLREAALKCLGYPLARAPQLHMEGEQARLGTSRLHLRRLQIEPGLQGAFAASEPLPRVLPLRVGIAELLRPWTCAA